MSLEYTAAAAPSLRHLKAARCIADVGSLSAAALQLNRTQSALTKALSQLERRLGVILFDRTTRGMAVTEPGRSFIGWVREAEAEFARAEAAYRSLVRSQAARHNPVFHCEVSSARLSAFLSVHETRDVTVAAERAGHTRAAVYASIRYLERLLELPLFEHAGAGLTPTAFADVLATHTRLAFSLIRHGLEELASAGGEIRGKVVIGTLPYSRTLLTPRTIHQVLSEHPRVEVSTREGPYRALETSLRSGELDLIVGATRPPGESAALVTEPLFEDELAVIAGAHHPLAHAPDLALSDLLHYGWVLPVRNTPARRLFDEVVAREGAAVPKQVVETSSMALIRGLLLESDRLALLSRHQVHHDERARLLVALPIRLEGTYRPIGITRRAHTTPSPAARVFMETLRQMAAALSRDRNLEVGPSPTPPAPSAPPARASRSRRPR